MTLLDVTLYCVILIQTSLTGLLVDAQDVEEIDAFVTEVMRCANIPGLTLGVVNNGETWLNRVYGVRDEETQAPVTDDTLFLLASTTKAFTGVSLALLMSGSEELSFQTPVRDILGDWFYLKDGTRTAQTQLRDVIAHRMGLPGHSEMRLAGWTLREFVERLQYLDYTYDFRDRYRYNSILYSIAALAAETIDGRNWTGYVQEEIFAPLGMSTSTFILNRERWSDFATAYYENNNGDNRAVSLEVPEAYMSVAPTSGSIASTATDMIQWLKFQINRGELEDGTVLLPSSDFTETHRSLIQRTANPDFQRPDDPVTYAPPSRYSLGWQETIYRGLELFTHTGSSGGFHSLVAVLPDLDHGLFIGINKSPDYFARDVISMYLLDTLSGVQPWLNIDTVCDVMNSKEIQRRNNRTTQILRRNEVKNRLDDDVKQNMVENYVGVYGNFAYGTVTVDINTETNDLVLRYGRDNWTWDLTQDADNEDDFTGSGREPFWFLDLDVTFEQEGSSPASALTILTFDDELPPRFERDLDFDNPPAPPVPCV